MTSPASQAASSTALDKLHGFYQPSPVPWTPHTLGWYIIFGILALLVVWLTIWEISNWRRNRYRREALRELASTSPEQLSGLLKRTALAAWPREQVASLSGDKWIGFLAESSAIPSFRESPGNLIEQIAFAPSSLSSKDEVVLRDLSAQWIRRHRVQA
jgi:Domain of unknown function (DUF4381)